MESCLQDGSFGPLSTCRQFDFTITFESAIIAIPASAIFLLLCSATLYHLHGKPRLMQPYRYLPALGKQLVAWKVGMSAATFIADLIALAAWASTLQHSAGGNIALAALCLRAAASLFQVPLLYFEFFRRYQASPLFPLYLTIVTICDIARVRTFALTVIHASPLFFGSFVAAYACRAVSWLLETAPKGAFVERADGDKVITGEETSSFFATLFITCVDPVLLKGFRQDLTLQSLGAIQSRYESEYLFEVGNPLWKRHVSSGKRFPLLRTMFSAFGSTLLAPILPVIVYSLASITQPTLINHVIIFVESYQTGNATDREPVSHGWGLVGAYALIFLTSTLSWSMFQMSALRCSVAMRGLLVQMIYQKALRIHQDTAKEVGAGSSTSLMSVDVERIVAQCEPFHLLYSALIMVLIGFVILYNAVGISFVTPIIVAVLFIASIPVLTRRIPQRQKNWSRCTDLRVKLFNSAIRNIKAVKMSGYEDIMIDKLQTLRGTEVGKQLLFYRDMLLVSAITNWLKGMLSLGTLVTYSVVSHYSASHEVNTSTFFTVIAVLVVITDPLLIVGQRYASIMAASASIMRIEDFLRKQEKDDQRLPGDAIIAKNASLGTAETVLLKNLDFAIPLRKMTMIVGSVGSGKTSLLDGLMGELDLLDGTLTFPKDSSTNFCAQDPWLRPGESVRQNIQFQAPFSPALYRRIVKACALDIDFRIWPEGDKQKAQGLSGGQRQRIALARSLYSRPEILILDDIFSAVDKTTEQHIFESLFGSEGLLAGTTVILATNAVHRLQSADYILIIDDETVKEQGTFAELTARPGAVTELVTLAGTASKSGREDGHINKPAPNDIQSSFVASLEEGNEEVDAEMASTQANKNSVLVWLLAGGRLTMACALSLAVVSSAIPSVIPVYVQAWTTALKDDRGKLFTYMGGYIGIEFGYITAFIISLFYFYLFWSAATSTRLHGNEVNSIFKTPLSYFDDKPIGRILSRFSQDLYVIDFELPMAFGNLVGLGVEMAATIIILTVAAPYVGIILFATIAICVLAQRFYVRTSRQVRRMDFIAKSPLYTLFAETMDTAGLKTIRAMRAEDSLSKQCVVKGNNSQVPYYLMMALKKWLNLVLGMVVTIINVGLVTVAVVFRSGTSSGLLAVALVQSTSLVFTLSFVVLAAAEFETCLVAVSRIQEIIELSPEEETTEQRTLPLLLAREDDADKDPDEKNGKVFVKTEKPDWITAGSILFQKVVLKYKPELPPALNNVSFRIQGGQKVGIVGRTGCGKSTVLQALFRMLECESGQICIDGIDIRQLPRVTLRQALTIIPQDPLLLELSVRENLDLEGQRTDQEIWAALDKTRCKALIEALPEKLDTIITGDGGNFSRGERQLLAMSRALLRSKKILVLDEASSSLDVTTDAIIQKVLREVFANCTIIAIAHRLNTLLDFDQVIVLSDGEVIETGKPQDLMRKNDSAFSQLLHGSGIVEMDSPSAEKDSGGIIAEL